MTEHRPRPSATQPWEQLSNLRTFFDFIFGLSRENLFRFFIAVIAAVLIGIIFPPSQKFLFPDVYEPISPEALYKDLAFRRGWVKPNGEAVQSDMFQNSRLRNDVNWGALLAIVMPQEVSPETDPFTVLKDNGLNASSLIVVSNKPEGFDAPQSGYLTFIPNEAILSDEQLAPNESRTRYTALKKAIESRKEINQEISSLPLVLFADNIGTFRVSVQVDGQQATQTKESFTVEATAGFQNSGIRVTKGQHIKIAAEGRIHLSIQQLYNLARTIKPMIANHSLEEDLSPEIRDKYSTKHKAFLVLK